MIAQRQGSSRLPLDPKGQLRTLVGDILRIAGLESELGKVMKRIAVLTGAPGFNSMIGVGDARLPLIVDDGCLYTERSRWLEQRVAVRLAAARWTPSTRGDLDAGNRGIATAAGTALALRRSKRHAVELAVSGKLAVVTGGPGTGKTLVAASIVRGLARMGIGPIALAAQTGKAANRLTEVIGAQLAQIASPTASDRALIAAPPVAQTLHRLLGYRGERFAHHARSPLPLDALIVDEASMIDLELMDALLDALPATAPLVLIGDAHQLPAIDAGRILADLAEPDGAAMHRVAVLEHSYRMDADDPRGRAVLPSCGSRPHRISAASWSRAPTRSRSRARRARSRSAASSGSMPRAAPARMPSPLRCGTTSRVRARSGSRTTRSFASTMATSRPRRPPSWSSSGS